MRRTLSAAALVFAWLCAQGASIESLQVFAWARMFTGYVQTMHWQSALAETFDPEKPCGLCSALQQARDAERPDGDAPPVSRDVAKLVLVLAEEEASLTPTSFSARAVCEESRPATWLAAVPTPPPRGA